MTAPLRITHVCLRSVYTEGMSYQDNLLPDQNAADGHNVTVIAGCEKYVGGRIVETPAEDRILPNGIRLIRLRMAPLIHPAITQRFGRAVGLREALEDAAPDVILHHGAVGRDLLTVSRYKDRHPDVRLLVDSHEDRYTSGTNAASLWIQYKLFNRALVRATARNVEKFLYISMECRDFLEENYGLPRSRMEYFPLGGTPISQEDRCRVRKRVRMSLQLDDEAFLVVHSGKMTRGKKTGELIRAFSALKDPSASLLLIGSAEGTELAEIERATAADPRIRHLGWVRADDLHAYIASADVYAQPGTQSATLQNAICLGAPVIVYPYPSHEPFIDGNGLYVRNEAELRDALITLASDRSIGAGMSERSLAIGNGLLSYAALAKQMYRQ